MLDSIIIMGRNSADAPDNVHFTRWNQMYSVACSADIDNKIG